jgi:hypothetical protein
MPQSPADRRRDLQFRPVLLRHRTHLCHGPHYDAFVEKAVALRKTTRSATRWMRQPPSAPWPMNASPRPSPPHRRCHWRRRVAHIPTLPDDDGAYVSPQILTNVDHTMTVMREETFGPVVGIMKVENDEEAIALMNDSALRPDRERFGPAMPSARQRLERGLKTASSS